MTGYTYVNPKLAIQKLVQNKWAISGAPFGKHLTATYEDTSRGGVRGVMLRKVVKRTAANTSLTGWVMADKRGYVLDSVPSGDLTQNDLRMISGALSVYLGQEISEYYGREEYLHPIGKVVSKEPILISPESIFIYASPKYFGRLFFVGAVDEFGDIIPVGHLEYPPSEVVADNDSKLHPLGWTNSITKETLYFHNNTIPHYHEGYLSNVRLTQESVHRISKLLDNEFPGSRFLHESVSTYRMWELENITNFTGSVNKVLDDGSKIPAASVRVMSIHHTVGNGIRWKFAGDIIFGVVDTPLVRLSLNDILAIGLEFSRALGRKLEDIVGSNSYWEEPAPETSSTCSIQLERMGTGYEYSVTQGTAAIGWVALRNPMFVTIPVAENKLFKIGAGEYYLDWVSNSTPKVSGIDLFSEESSPLLDAIISELTENVTTSRIVYDELVNSTNRILSRTNNYVTGTRVDGYVIHSFPETYDEDIIYNYLFNVGFIKDNVTKVFIHSRRIGSGNTGIFVNGICLCTLGAWEGVVEIPYYVSTLPTALAQAVLASTKDMISTVAIELPHKESVEREQRAILEFLSKTV